MRAAACCIVVPVKRLDAAKSRLAGLLPPEERVALVLAMLGDVLAAAREAHAGPLAVVTPDRRLAAPAAEFGAQLLRDAGVGYNAAIRVAAASPVVTAAGAMLVVPGDAARARPDDLRGALAAMERAEVVLAPADGGGTGALGLRPPDAIAPAFGLGSAAAHRAAAGAAGLRLEELDLPSLARDVDGADDLLQSEPPLGPRTAAFVEASATLNRVRRA